MALKKTLDTAEKVRIVVTMISKSTPALPVPIAHRTARGRVGRGTASSQLTERDAALRIGAAGYIASSAKGFNLRPDEWIVAKTWMEYWSGTGKTFSTADEAVAYAEANPIQRDE